VSEESYGRREIHHCGQPGAHVLIADAGRPRSAYMCSSIDNTVFNAASVSEHAIVLMVQP